MTDRTRTTRPRRLASAFLLALMALALLAPGARAQGADVGITGTVTNATTEETVADAPVRVAFFDAQGQTSVEETITGADGTFSVAPPGGATGYQVAVDHDGAEFRGVATQLLAGQPSVASIQVWDTTKNPDDITLANWIVWIDEDAETGAWNIQQDFGWSNAGDTAYIGDGGATVTVPLTSGAANLQFLGTFLEHQGEVVDDSYVSSAPIVPGDTTATIFYSTPDLPDLLLPAQFDVGVFQMFVPMGLQAEGDGLRLAGTQSDQGVTYQVYAADALTAGAELQVSFTQVAVPEAESDATTYLLIGVAVLALAAAGFFFVRGRRRSRVAPPSGPKKARPAQPQNRSKPARPTEVTTRPANGQRAERPAVAVDGTEDDDEVQLLIDEIAALDLSFEKGLMDERTYRRLRVAAKDRLLLAQEAAPGSRSTR